MNENFRLPQSDRNHTVFIHYPPDKNFREHICALILAVIATGHGIKGDFYPHDRNNPKLESLVKYISESKYSIHNCSLCKASLKTAMEFARYNVPIELGIAIAERYRLQSINAKYNETLSHEYYIFVKENHAYKKTISGVTRPYGICGYKSALDILEKALLWLSEKDTAINKTPTFDQVKNVWKELQEKHPKYFKNDYDNGNDDDNYGLYLDKLHEYILKILKEKDWWEEPEWMKNQNQGTFDVFLSHNSKDKEQIEKIAKILQDNKLKPWIDSRQLMPGSYIDNEIEKAILNCKSFAIFFSANGLGEWQSQELSAAMSCCFKGKINNVIPVLLPNFTDLTNLPLFIQRFHWVEFSNIEDPKAIRKLIRGIHGQDYLNY